ncbi:MAG: hypothetical protein CSB44_04340 [Gammaproteobacteria bacterium]|nr:MAG: hypothetical protein CSB44_04340 [Gammaproteobacteria bacterium]
MKTWVGLIRGIGPSTHPVMPLRELQDRCTAAGLSNTQSLLATGNLVFETNLPEQEIQQLLNDTIKSFGLENHVVLRRPKELRRAAHQNPFPDAASDRPAKLLVLFLPEQAEPAAEATIAERAGSERVSVSEREVYIDYRAGVARSRLSPAFLERVLHQSGTARNWNTLTKLCESSHQREG